MASNPLVAQGVLNRVRGSIVIPNFSSLNVSASYLGEQGISLSRNGSMTTFLPTMTGQATSPEPYQAVTLTVNLLRTQALAAQYEAQMALTTLLGDITIYTDASTLGEYLVNNAAIENVGPLSFAGKDAGYVVTIGGFIVVNNNLFDLT